METCYVYVHVHASSQHRVCIYIHMYMHHHTWTLRCARNYKVCDQGNIPGKNMTILTQIQFVYVDFELHACFGVVIIYIYFGRIHIPYSPVYL